MKKEIFYFISLSSWIVFFPLPNLAQVQFQTGQSFTTPGSWFEVVVVGDVNSDGRNDVVAATGFYFNAQYDYKLMVYLQTSQGTFSVPVYYSYSKVYPGIKAIDLKDVNNDNLNDVIIGYGDSMAVFFQNTLHTLNPPVSYFSGTDVDDLKVGDVNNDGLNDIVVCHWNTAFLRVFYQTPTGFSSTGYPKPQAGYDEIEIGDLNSDGLNDVVFMAGQGVGGIHVMLQNAWGTLNNYISYFPNPAPFQFLNGIAIGDINNDEANDIVGTQGGNMPDANLVIWYQDPTTHVLKPPVTVPAYQIPENISVADFDCDGKQELVLNHGGWAAITIWTLTPSNTYTNYNTYPVSVAHHPKPEGLAIGDLNSDGNPDIVTVGNLTTLQLLYNISTPTSFSIVDTLVLVDTFYTHTDKHSYYYVYSTAEQVSEYIITRTDSFQVNYYGKQDSIITRYLYIKTASMCDSVYTKTDTTAFLSSNKIVKRDTVYLSRTIDSLLIEPIIVAPNPFSNQLTVKLRDKKPLSLWLYNSLGQQILQHTFSISTVINTDLYASGVYYYQLTRGNKTLKTGKVVKQ